MIRWSPIKLKLTLGIGSLASVGLVGEVSQNAIPAWLAVSIAILPVVVFVFADPDDIRASIVRRMQLAAALWYLAVNSTLVVLSVAGGLKAAWWLMFIFLAIGAIPCLIVIARAVAPWEEPPWQNDILQPIHDVTEPHDFSQPVEYRPKKLKTFWLLILSCVFVAGGLGMVRDGQLLGWLVAVFFGLGVIVFALQFITNCSYLRVSPIGIEISSLWRKSTYKWADISRFYAGCAGRHEMVLFDFSPSYKRSQKGRAVAKALAGADAGLPDTYGLTAEALVAVLNEWIAAQVPIDENAGAQVGS